MYQTLDSRNLDFNRNTTADYLRWSAHTTASPFGLARFLTLQLEADCAARLGDLLPRLSVQQFGLSVALQLRVSRLAPRVHTGLPALTEQRLLLLTRLPPAET